MEAMEQMEYRRVDNGKSWELRVQSNARGVRRLYFFSPNSERGVGNLERVKDFHGWTIYLEPGNSNQ